MAGYIGTTPVPQATQHRESFTATGGQTSFATAGYTPQFIDVYLNGVKLAPADFTATNGSDVVLASGATASDILEIVAYTPFEVANQTFTGTTTAANLTVTGAFTSQGIDDNADAVAITIDSSENVGIGTSSPSRQLHLSGSTPIIRLTDTDTNAYGEISSSSSDGNLMFFADQGNTQANTTIRFYVDASERMRIDSSGRVGIGTSSPSSPLQIQSSNNQIRLVDSQNTAMYCVIETISDAGLSFNADVGGAAASSRIQFNVDNSEKMRIDSSGNLLVGKTAQGLTNAGFEVAQSGQASATQSGASALRLNRLTSDGEILQFRKDGSTVGSIGVGGGRPYFVADNGSNGGGFKVDSTQFYPVDRTGAVSNGVLDLGYNNGRWQDLYLSGGVYLGGTGSANKLDDYEEGTWTPVSDYGTLTSVTATYTKIGNSVFIRLDCTMPSTSSSSHMIIQGLPFTTAQDGSAQIGYTGSTNYNPAILMQGTICAFYSGSGGAVAASAYSGSIVRFTGQYNTTA